MSAPAAAERRTVSVPGAELAYTTRGRGPTCLVLANLGAEVYGRLMPAALSDRLRLVLVDLRGTGRSTGDPTALDFDRLAADLEAVRADLGVGRVAVLGYSIVGLLAIEYGRRCPESVSHVITAGTPPKGDMAWLMREAQTFFARDASDERKQRLARNLAALPAGAGPAEMALAQTPMRFFDAGFDAASLFAGAETSAAFLGHVMRTLAPAWDVTVDSGALRVPLFLAHGRHDYVVPHVLWDGIPPTLPDATFQLFERSGHQTFLEEPEAFAAAVAAWMQR
jgi:proline iminopeptidase